MPMPSAAADSRRRRRRAFEYPDLSAAIGPVGHAARKLDAADVRARQNAIDAGRVLASRGAKLDLVDPDGATALVVAIINANYDFAAMLLDAGADPNVADKDAGMAALYATADMHRLAIGHGRPTRNRPACSMRSI
jgi:ankyrin repeat protein